MKKNALSLWLGLFAVLAPGAVGLAIVGATLAAYWGRDPQASYVVLAMGAALLVGVLELVLRQVRSARLAREVASLPATPSEATLDGASPLLAALLRARLEQGGPLGLGDSLSPYLSGLLVMLGLLGTLLGLFETVHGASRALTASADVEALRRSLTTPIEGLTRSFGCSAAGIGASAMLGLAVALVRRREGRLLGALQAYALGPLRVLSPTRRQARAVEQLAAQGGALPDAARVLEQVGAQLGGLSAQLTGAQDAALARHGEALTAMVEGLARTLEKTAASAGTALHAQVAPIVHEAALKQGEAIAAQTAALGEATRAVTTQLAAEVAARRGEADALLATLGARLDEAERRRSEAHAEELARLTELASGSLRALALREEALGRRLDAAEHARSEAHAEELAQLTAVATRTLADLEAQGSALGARIDQAERARSEAQAAELAQLTELATRSLREVEAREAAVEARSAALLARFGEAVEGLREAERAERARLDALSERVGGELAALSDALRTQATTRRAEDEAADARAADALARLAESAALLDANTQRQGSTVDALIARVPALLSEVAEATQRGASEGIAQLVAHTEAQLGAVSAQLAEALGAQAARSEREDARAEAARLQLEASAGEAQTRLVEGAALLEQSMARQGEVLEQLVGRVGGLLEAHADTVRARTEATLASVASRSEEHATQLAALEDRIDAGRAAQVEALGAALHAHAKKLEEKLAGTSELVREAAGTFQVASAEMQAVAELFARSIDRQREASDAWLESLGDLEGAVAQAGRGAAADALADQLASTQEVFARQLQFQRELFEQLRTLRAATPRTPRSEEHDVSV